MHSVFDLVLLGFYKLREFVKTFYIRRKRYHIYSLARKNISISLEETNKKVKVKTITNPFLTF
jgi:predicted nucleotidyltransferase